MQRLKITPSVWHGICRLCNISRKINVVFWTGIKSLLPPNVFITGDAYNEHVVLRGVIVYGVVEEGFLFPCSCDYIAKSEWRRAWRLLHRFLPIHAGVVALPLHQRVISCVLTAVHLTPYSVTCQKLAVSMCHPR